MDLAGGAVILVIAGVLRYLQITIVEHRSEFAVAPRIVARQDLKLWHGVGSGMYLLQWLCAGVVLWKLAGRQKDF